jgi:hypothetical protein
MPLYKNYNNTSGAWGWKVFSKEEEFKKTIVIEAMVVEIPFVSPLKLWWFLCFHHSCCQVTTILDNVSLLNDCKKKISWTFDEWWPSFVNVQQMADNVSRTFDLIMYHFSKKLTKSEII